MRRRYGWKRDLPDHRDRYYASRKPQLTLPASVDLRFACPPVEDQGQLGSCTANALAGAMEILELKAQKTLTDLSRLFIYYNERAMEGDPNQDNGAQIRDGIKSLAALGVCPESEWPYDPAQFAVKPPSTCYVDALACLISTYHRLQSLDDMQVCLAEGVPFVMGISVFDSFESGAVAKDGIVPMPEPDESCLGGHAVCVVGYDMAKQTFLIRNSWGTDWGMAGYFTLPFEYVSQLADDAWVIFK